jgi:hypothetical protein
LFSTAIVTILFASTTSSWTELGVLTTTKHDLIRALLILFRGRKDREASAMYENGQELVGGRRIAVRFELWLSTLETPSVCIHIAVRGSYSTLDNIKCATRFVPDEALHLRVPYL